MTPTWILAIAAIVAMAATGGGVVLHLGRVEGRITTVLEQLVKIAEDHEKRIRAGELRCNGTQPRPHRRGF